MSLILLDAGLVGLAISEPRGRDPQTDEELKAFQQWYTTKAGTVHRFAIANITRYEVRRELLRLKATAKLARLDRLGEATIPVGMSDLVWDEAATLWAIARLRGTPTASPDALDGDALLAATMIVMFLGGLPATLATTNVKHLTLFGIDARGWRDIPDAE